MDVVKEEKKKKTLHLVTINFNNSVSLNRELNILL